MNPHSKWNALNESITEKMNNEWHCLEKCPFPEGKDFEGYCCQYERNDRTIADLKDMKELHSTINANDRLKYS